MEGGYYRSILQPFVISKITIMNIVVLANLAVVQVEPIVKHLL